MAIEPFRIEVTEAELDDLRRRIDATRWPDQIPGSGWTYGTDGAYLRPLADYWAEGYDWRAHEARLNGFPQFTAEVDGQRLHFLHVRSPHEGALPLLLTSPTGGRARSRSSPSWSSPSPTRPLTAGTRSTPSTW